MSEKPCPFCNNILWASASLCHHCGATLLSPSVASNKTQALPSGTYLNGGRYKVVSVLGRGAFGITYRAQHLLESGYVAIKEHFPEEQAQRNAAGNVEAIFAHNAFALGLERFRHEATVLAALQHPAIVEFKGVWHERGTAYLAMEMLEGQTLEQTLARHGPLQPSVAWPMLLRLLQGLVLVHDRGLLHRDIKPANIVLAADGPVLVDFGSTTKWSNTQRQRISNRVLTPAYAPLEQFGEVVRLSPATDLYALAATFYEALTGVAPTASLERANGVALPDLGDVLPSVPLGFSQVLQRALALRLEQRFPSAQAMHDALMQLPEFEAMRLAQCAAPAFSAGSAPNSALSPAKRKPTPIAVVVLVLYFLFLAVFVLVNVLRR